MAGSPIQPKARPATVTPSWTAGRNSSIECLSLRAVRAPGRPRAMSCWMRVSRTLTRANELCGHEEACGQDEEGHHDHAEEHPFEHSCQCNGCLLPGI